MPKEKPFPATLTITDDMRGHEQVLIPATPEIVKALEVAYNTIANHEPESDAEVAAVRHLLDSILDVDLGLKIGLQYPKYGGRYVFVRELDPETMLKRSEQDDRYDKDN